MKNDNLKQIFDQTQVPEPEENARKASISVALAEFDKKNQNSTQGSSLSSRLINMLNQLDRRINMKRAYYYGASITTIAVCIGLLTYNEFTANIAADHAPASSHHQANDVFQDTLQSPFEGLFKSEKKDASKQAFTPIHEPQGQPVAIAPPAVMPIPSPAYAPLPMREKYSGTYNKSKVSDKTVMADQSRAYGGAVGSISSNFAPQAPGMPNQYDVQFQQQQVNNDRFEKFKDNSVKLVKEEAVSTFSIDVNTSSYSFLRRELNVGVMPPKDSVRVEEMVNYFDYNYALPESKSEPFKPSVTVFPSPWHKGNKLIHIGIKGYDIAPTEKPHANLVFLIDTSGSMTPQDRLPLVVSSLEMLVNTLDENDTVSIVTYAGYAGVALEPTQIKDKQKILSVLQSLHTGGGTYGSAGLQTAYDLAEKNFDKKGVNRIILATDGDFNLGVTGTEDLQTFVEKKRDTGIFLSVLGVGQDNYNDQMMQRLAQNGNGNAAYIDNINEARKVLVQEAGSTIFTIAKDVKLQVEFNKDKVSEYRLVGYETRLLNREDFNNDKVDAGEIGSGHAVTAIYEITPKGEKGLVDESRYEAKDGLADNGLTSNEYGFLKIRYKLPKESVSKLMTTPISAKNEVATVDAASTDVRFATAVAAFGQILRGDSYINNFTFDDVEKLAGGAKGDDKFGYRNEFINLVKTAKALPGNNNPLPPEPPVYGE